MWSSMEIVHADNTWLISWSVIGWCRIKHLFVCFLIKIKKNKPILYRQCLHVYYLLIVFKFWNLYMCLLVAFVYLAFRLETHLVLSQLLYQSSITQTCMLTTNPATFTNDLFFLSTDYWDKSKLIVSINSLLVYLSLICVYMLEWTQK